MPGTTGISYSSAGSVVSYCRENSYTCKIFELLTFKAVRYFKRETNFTIFVKLYHFMKEGSIKKLMHSFYVPLLSSKKQFVSSLSVDLLLVNFFPIIFLVCKSMC